MSEYDPSDAMLERMAREEQDDINRKHGEGILSAIDGAAKRREDAVRALLDALSRAQSGGDDAA